jgi:hypothetical protein
VKQLNSYNNNNNNNNSNAHQRAEPRAKWQIKETKHK